MVLYRIALASQKCGHVFAALSFFLSLILGAVLFEDLAVYDLRLFLLACAALAIAMNVLVWLSSVGLRKLHEKKVQRNVSQQ